MGASPTRIARPRGNSKELLCPTKLQFMVKNEWWTYPHIPFPIFIYLFIFLSFGFSFRSTDVLDCIESGRNIFGFWILLIIPVPLNPSPPPPPGWGYGKRISFRPFFLYSKLSILNTLKWDLYVLLVRLKSVIYPPTLAKRPKRSSRSIAHRHWRPFSQTKNTPLPGRWVLNKGLYG